VVIDRVTPAVDGGRFPIKRTVGDKVNVRATVFADGHDGVVAQLRYRRMPPIPDPNTAAENNLAESWNEMPMTSTSPGTDEWTAAFEVDGLGWYEYSISGWVDAFRAWRRNLEKKAAAGQEISVELLEGSMLIRESAARASLVPAPDASGARSARPPGTA